MRAYTTASNAADVEDLVWVLGYKEWNLYSSSYGTKLALTVMRDFPAGVRSVILDSTFPPQADLFATLAVNGERALKLVFENCAADPACSQAYPGLEGVFYDLVNQLDVQPVILSIFNPEPGSTLFFSGSWAQRPGYQ